MLCKGQGSGYVNVDLYKFDFSESTESASLRLRGYALDEMDDMAGRSSDPFFEVCRPHQSKESEDVTWVPVYRSEVIEKNVNPNWKPFTVPLSALNGPIKIAVLEFDYDGNHDLIGHVETTLQQLWQSVSTAVHSLKDLDLMGKTCPSDCIPIVHPNTKKK